MDAALHTWLNLLYTKTTIKIVNISIVNILYDEQNASTPLLATFFIFKIIKVKSFLIYYAFKCIVYLHGYIYTYCVALNKYNFLQIKKNVLLLPIFSFPTTYLGLKSILCLILMINNMIYYSITVYYNIIILEQ